MDFFFWICFWSKKGLEIRFKDVLDRTESFYDYKNNIFQGLKNGIFPKGLAHAFGQKNAFFFYCKNNIFQRPQNRTFPKGLTNTFGKKNAIFFIFSFRPK